MLRIEWHNNFTLCYLKNNIRNEANSSGFNSISILLVRQLEVYDQISINCPINRESTNYRQIEKIRFANHATRNIQPVEQLNILKTNIHCGQVNIE